jgi:hypothetical protein
MLVKKFLAAVGLAATFFVSVAVAQIVLSPPAADIHINGHTYTNLDWQASPQGTLSAIANDVGAVTQAYPQGRFTLRVPLTSDLTMYVGGAGASDLNNCLLGTPCATVQRPFDLLRDRYDLAGHTVTVQLADGSYSPGLSLQGKLIGQLSPANLILRGNNANPSAVAISDNRGLTALDDGVGSAIFVSSGGALTIGGVRLSATYRSLWAHTVSNVTFGFMDFGPAGNSHIVADEGSLIRAFASYSISGSSGAHYAVYGGHIYTYEPANPAELTVVTINGFPSFGWFAFADGKGHITSPASRTSFSGSVGTAHQYQADGMSLIDTVGSGANYFPGICPCFVVNGSIYK